MSKKEDKVTIKKYSNRRLYNTAISQYITQEDLVDLIKSGEDFEVVDAKTGKDLTRQVLSQIIVEQELKGIQLLPLNFMKRLITMHDDKIGDMMSHYLDSSMEQFVKEQEKLRENWSNQFPNLDPFKAVGTMTEQNMKLFNESMKLFDPFGFTKKRDDK